MEWRRIVNAAFGHPKSLHRIACRGSNADSAALTPLLLLEEAPHPAAALVVAAMAQKNLAPPIHAALAPSVAPALAAWRDDQRWTDRAIGDAVPTTLASGVAEMVGALRDRSAALHDAVAIVVRGGDSAAVDRCLATLGASGWMTLDGDLRTALLTRADIAARGWVWSALDAQQRAATVQAAKPGPLVAAQIIGRIGAAAWRATDPDLRRDLIGSAWRDSGCVPMTASAWSGMTDDERTLLVTTVTVYRKASDARNLLERLGPAGRAALTVKQRAEIESCARKDDAWAVLALRGADAGWSALSDQERRAVLAATEEKPWRVSALLHIVGATGWRAMTADEQTRLADVVRRTSDALFACPPALWRALAGDALPPATDSPAYAADHWRAEDADADLGDLPAMHQALVLALAPWRAADAAPDSVRVRRLRAGWDALTDDERVALALAHPSAPAVVAAAARLAGGGAAALDAVGEAAARVVTATGGADVKRAVGDLLRAPDDWRAWMVAFAPTADDPPEVWGAWRAAARRGVIDNLAICARLATGGRGDFDARRTVRRVSCGMLDRRRRRS